MSKIVQEFPPNYEDICAAIPAVRRNPSIVFVYGDTIYSPSNAELRDDLIIHEEVHVERQTDPEAWWQQYLTDPKFRLEEELVAYRAQWQYLMQNSERPIRRRILNSIAKDLAGAMYGKIVTRDEATKLIQGKEA